MIPNIFVVVPHHRPKDLRNIIFNLKHQTLSHKLIIVENGDAVGTTPDIGATIITSGKHQSLARNAGLQKVKELGGGYIAFMDSDDFYEPNYLQELYSNTFRATVIGKRIHKVKLSDGKLYLFNKFKSNQLTNLIHGATIFVNSNNCLEFPMTDINEDGEWSVSMKKAGFTLWASSEDNYIYNRCSENHTWNTSDILLRYQLGDCIKLDIDEVILQPTDDEIFDYLAAENLRKL